MDRRCFEGVLTYEYGNSQSQAQRSFLHQDIRVVKIVTPNLGAGVISGFLVKKLRNAKLEYLDSILHPRATLIRSGHQIHHVWIIFRYIRQCFVVDDSRKGERRINNQWPMLHKTPKSLSLLT